MNKLLAVYFHWHRNSEPLLAILMNLISNFSMDLSALVQEFGCTSHIACF
jgi:hypothetical protein